MSCVILCSLVCLGSFVQKVLLFFGNAFSVAAIAQGERYQGGCACLCPVSPFVLWTSCHLQKLDITNPLKLSLGCTLFSYWNLLAGCIPYFCFYFSRFYGAFYPVFCLFTETVNFYLFSKISCYTTLKALHLSIRTIPLISFLSTALNILSNTSLISVAGYRPSIAPC